MTMKRLAGLRRLLPTISFSWSWSWQFVSTVVIVGAGISLLLFSQLESLLPGYSTSEVATAQASSSLSVIAENPINAPYKLLVYGITAAGLDPLLATRVGSAVVGTATLLLFYVGVRHWHSKRVAFLSTLLFACSAWFLHTARFGTSDIMLPFTVLLFATCGYWIAASEARSGVRYVAGLAALGLSLYVPGAIWFVLIGLLIRRGKDLAFIREKLRVGQKLVLLGLLVLFIGVPLTYGLLQTPSLAPQLLALPTSMPNWMDVLQNFLLLPIQLIAWSNFSAEMWLGNLPLLDAFVSAMLLLGLYYCLKNWKLDRSKLILSAIFTGGVLISLGGVSISMLLPVVYVTVAGGIAVLLGMWLTVFPRNPLARSLGILLVTIAVGASLLFNLRAYFIAWPYNLETRAVYTEKSVTISD